MTKYDGVPRRFCGVCIHFQICVCNYIGMCDNEKSDHYRHVLVATHPQCSEWKMKQ